MAEEAFTIAGVSDKYPYKRTDEPNEAFDTVPTSIDEIAYLPSGWKPQTDDPTYQPTYTGGDGGYDEDDLLFNINNPSDITQGCQCNENGDYREPSGCVLVEETQFSPYRQGVRHIAVDFLGPWGQYEIMWTNDKGCFKKSRKIRYKIHSPFTGPIELPVVMRVMFLSGEATVRSLVPATLYIATKPACLIVGNVAGYGLNNLQVNILRTTNPIHKTTSYYFAAITNNAHYEIKDLCWQDGITPPHSDMHYLIQPFNNSGSAPMLRQMLKQGAPANIINQAVVMFTLSSSLPAIGFSVEAYINIAPPDIAIGCKREPNLDDYSTDRIREVVYHEMGHAVHYRKVGVNYWRDVVDFESQRIFESGGADSYGNGSHAGAGKIHLVETWGNHIGHLYTHRRYKSHHSLGTPLTEKSWMGELESRISLYGQNAWIKFPVLLDLMDNNIQNNTIQMYEDQAFMGVPPGANDNVSGFTNSMFYSELGSQDMTDFINKLKNNHLPGTGNSVSSFDLLMSTYGL